MNLDKCYVLDIETNDLLANMLDYSSFPYKLNSYAKLWCVVIRNIGTNEVFTAVKEEITSEWFQETLADCEYLIAHNGIKFDFITLKLFGVFDYEIGYPGATSYLFGKPVTFIDTLIVSRILNPDRYLGHSLDSWGQRTGNLKTDFRSVCVENGIVEASSPKGSEFRIYSEFMLPYCEQDTNTNKDVLLKLIEEMDGYNGWVSPIHMENKLADLAIRRESLGFWFDKELAIKCVKELSEKMQAISDAILPILPPKKMNKGELDKFTAPKVQFKKDGTLSANMLKFIEKVGAELIEEGVPKISYEGKVFELPCEEPLQVYTEASMKDLDHIKMHLISLGWVPTEWRQRDLTKDAKKQSIPYEKRIKALHKWFEETINGKYKKERFDELGIPEEDVLEVLSEKLNQDWPVRIPTSPSVRVGVEKELCSNLVALGDKVSFAGDFALYLTYKHRKSSIAGGEIEDMDFDIEYPNTGFLSNYREIDGRVPTPAIEIGASTSRYRHISVANIPRASSVYGKEMRSLFGSGPNALQFGYDFSSLEARVMGHYVIKYKDGEDLAQAMLAEKPNDIHSVNGRKLGIPRSDAKSLTYAILYGASPNKISKMLNVSLERAKEVYDEFWNAVPALKELKEKVEKYWEDHGKKFIRGIDGRKINIRSAHSILNALFQSTGVIAAKYVNVLSMQKLEKMGHIIDPFISIPSVCEMIAYHDECQLFTAKENIKFKTFASEEEAKQFVETWSEDGQLSAISEGKKWYLALPNDISLSIEESIKDTEKILKFNVPLGYEWIVNTTWYGCH